MQEALPQYDVLDELGRGAFGVVYLARHRQLGREVAIKQLPRAFAADPDVRARFVAEARSVASLDHPHIVPVYDFIDRDDGMCLTIMERCMRSVSDDLESRGLATDEACAAVIAGCAALDEAHAHGLLHRDVKPENLLYDAKGVVKLADFGIARVRTGNARRTATGTVMGTPAYMSPEQVRGEELTPASDVYSMGVTAYELLTGSLPFPGAATSTGLLAHHLVTPPTPLLATRPELPHAVATVVDRALAKDVADRPQSALDLALELTTACVASFGEGWLRRRRFVLHWPDVLAVSERPAPNTVRTGTIVVKRVVEPSEDDRADGAQDAGAPTGSGGTVLVPPPPPGPVPPTPGPLPPPDRPAAPLGPPSVAPTPAAATPAAPTPAAPGIGSPGGPNRRRGLLIGGALAAALALVVAIVLLTGGGGDTDAGDDGSVGSAATDGTATTETAATAEAPDPTDSGAVDTTAAGTTAPTTTIDPLFVFERPPDLDFTRAESAFAPTPCPDDQPRHACIWLAPVANDPEDGDLSVYYFTSGFVPELEPADYHLHFYLDTDVDGDERKAGTEIPGSTWKPWDGPFPFSTSNGQNGRTGFSLADIEASGARQVCVIVADAESRAIPGTGNCAPIIREWDPAIATQQVERITGQYLGGCSIGGSLILPDAWHAVDLVATPVAQAAAELRPTATAAMQERLERLVEAGGVLYADGPVLDGFVPSVRVIDVPGEFALGDTPNEVVDRLVQLGVDIGVTDRRTVVDRVIAVGVLDGQGLDGGDLVSYVVPDAGHALIVTFEIRDASVPAALKASDKVIETVNGC